MIKVLFLINSLGGGGAERVLVNLVNNMDKSRFSITVQTVFPAGVNKEYLSPEVELVEGKLPLFKGASTIFKILPGDILLKVCEVKNDYDVVIAYMHGIPTKILWRYQAAPKLAWLHCDMEHSSLPKYFTTSQIAVCFNTYESIVGVSQSVCDSFAKLYGLDQKLRVIYNTNDTKKIRELSQEDADSCQEWRQFSGIKLISIGRLHPQKGYDRLIDICKKIKEEKLEYKLLILGTGVEKDNLEQQVKKYGLEDQIILGGYVNNPYPFIKAADIFVCSSRYEGLSTVMSETIILGTPIITTDVSGAKEVLGEKSEYGLVVDNDEDALYDGLKKLLNNPEMLMHYREKASERAAFFETKHTVHAVEELIEEVWQCRK